VTVAVKSGDLRLACAISTALRARPRVRLLRPEQEARAEALLVLALELDEEALALMRSACTEHGRPRIVLVAQYVERARLVRAVRHGLVGVLPRRTGLDQIVLALLRTREGRMRLSDSALVDGLDLRHRAQAIDGVAPYWAP
jgi:ActR/RegA family two-component response regulator